LWASQTAITGKKAYDVDSQGAYKGHGHNPNLQQNVVTHSPRIIKQQTPMNMSTDFNGHHTSPRSNFGSTRPEVNAVAGKAQQAQQLKQTLSSMALERRNLMDSMRTNKGAGEAQQELKIQLQILNNNIDTVQEKI